MSRTRVLIVHRDPSVAALMTSMLQTLGHKIDEAPNDSAAVRMLEHAPVDLVLAGADPEDVDALEFLSYVRRKAPSTPIVLLFSEAHPDRTREALVRGAATVLRYPLSANTLRAAVAQALGQPELTSSRPAAPANGHAQAHGHGNGHGHGSPTATLAQPRLRFEPPASAPASPGASLEPEEIIGDDPMLRQAIGLAGTIAASPAPVLIEGERGVGKTLLARTLHARGPRPDGPFVEVACDSLREDALEIELFGRRGAGPGDPDRPGKVAAADGGTLFLDEVESLSPALQSRLLRLLRDGEYEPVGSSRSTLADVRLVLGTVEDLASLVPEGRFRQDLYYRLSVVTLKIPPLRHRGADVERLADHFRVRFARQLGKDIRGLSPEALDVLNAHSWPGNVQELVGVIERAVIVCRGLRIEPNHLALIPRNLNEARPLAPRARRPDPAVEILPLKEALEEPEKQLILRALEALSWNRQETARVLDINRTTLYKKMKKYGLLFDEPAWAN